MTFDLVPANERARVATTWRELEATVGAGLTNSWDRVECWLRHYGDLVPHHFVVASGPHGAAGIALLTHGVGQKRGPFPIRSLHLGTAGEPPADTIWVEYNRLLVGTEDRSSFAAGLLGTVKATHLLWDILELHGFAPEEVETILSLEQGFKVSRRACYVADLRQMRDGHLFEGFKKEIVVKIRKDRHRFEERFGPITTTWAETVDDGLAILRELIPLHQERWQRIGEPGCFASTRFTGFHEDLIRRLLPKGQIVLFRVQAGEQLIGTFYGFVEGGVLYHYQWGLAQFDQNSLSPGFVVGALCMEEAMARGIDDLNWLAGDSRYKRELSNTQRE
ncbi:MAG TPA: GNAT family N-acetyltransferase, partial [Thermomicrobiales bacterium]|nr:GNAT family N-acetyltransferase [Thermomicrobiales bacterium]